ncbi:MAG: DUF6798 domain-containing protein [Blastocatellia bacterium]|nr:DUF6798 domain-containing protein [Blastocatellia bacterium]
MNSSDALQADLPAPAAPAGAVWERMLAFPSIVLSAILLTSAKGGISIGSSNHAGLLPVVRRILDPGYLPGDFNIQLRLYHHRVFAYLLAGLASLFGEARGIVLLHWTGALLLAASLWFLCRTLRLSLWSYLTLTLLLASAFLWVGWGLEENDFIGNPEVQPPLFAHAFVVFALALLIRSRHRLAAFCLGLAVLFHLQIGVTATLMVAPLYARRLREFGPREIARLALCYLAPAGFAIFHLVQMMQRGLLRPASRSWSLPFYIDFRHPHHFELMSAAHGLWVGGHFAAMLGIFFLMKRRGFHDAARAIGVFLTATATLALLSLIHFADYYLLRYDRFANLQVIRLSPLVTVLGAVSLLLLLDRLSRRLAERTGRRWVPAAAAAALLLVAAVAEIRAARRDEPAFHFGVVPYAARPTHWVRMCNWIRANGPTDAAYLTPPGETGFTSLAHRSNIVEFKINPDGAMHMSEWFERLQDLTGGRLPEDRGLKNRKPISKAYAKLTAEQLLAAGRKYNARYAVLSKENKVDFEVLFETGDLRLVRLF